MPYIIHLRLLVVSWLEIATTSALKLNLHYGRHNLIDSMAFGPGFRCHHISGFSSQPSYEPISLYLLIALRNWHE